MVYRLEVCKAFLVEGLSFNMLSERTNDSLRESLEQDRFLIDKQQIAYLISTLLEQELNKMIEEFKGLDVSF